MKIIFKTVGALLVVIGVLNLFIGTGVNANLPMNISIALIGAALFYFGGGKITSKSDNNDLFK